MNNETTNVDLVNISSLTNSVNALTKQLYNQSSCSNNAKNRQDEVQLDGVILDDQQIGLTSKTSLVRQSANQLLFNNSNDQQSNVTQIYNPIEQSQTILHQTRDEVTTMAEGGLPQPNLNKDSEEDAKYAKEVQLLKNQISKLKDGSVTRLLLELKLEMKMEGRQTRQELRNVVTSTTLMKNDISQIQTDYRNLNERVDTLQNFQDDQKNKVEENTTSLTENDKKVNILIDLMDRQDERLDHTIQESSAAEFRGNRNNLFIAGLEEDEEGRGRH